MVVYNQHLTPEMRRITTDAWGRWGKESLLKIIVALIIWMTISPGKEQLVNMSKVVNYNFPNPNPTPTPNGVILDESGIGMEVMSILLMIFLLQDFFTGGCQGGDDQEDTIGQEQEMRDQWETKELQNFCTLNIAI